MAKSIIMKKECELPNKIFLILTELMNQEMLINKQDMKYAVPFGPFLSAAAVAHIFWGDSFMRILFIDCY